jgi:hypothetical protein
MCPVCDSPVPPPKGKRIPHKKYCSESCRSWQSNQTAHSRKTRGYQLLNFMERNLPDALAKILNQMERSRRQ